MGSISMAPNQRMYQTNTSHKNNESSSMIPQGINGNVVFSKASAPTILKKQKNPSHVFINNTGSYYFTYESDLALGSSITDNYEFAMHIKEKNQGIPVRLDIQPCAWSSSLANETGNVGNVGDVTFVYKGQ
tara:strand:- start:1153 stop:1545 length:393 start_codon:yes stop_codon:yes gene_type:complete